MARVREEVPHIVLDQFRKQADPGEEPRISVAADIGEDGTLQEKWVIVTSKRVFVFPSKIDMDGRAEIPLKQIKTARSEVLVGGGRLEIDLDEDTRELVYYSNSKLEQFAEVARGIDKLAKGEPFVASEEEDKVRCGRCGRLLPEKNGTCPACVRKIAVLARIASYLKPYRVKATILVVVTLLGTMADVVPPYVTKIIIDDVLPSKNLRLLLLVCLALLGVRLIKWVSEMAHGWIVVWLGSRVTADIREHLYLSLEKLTLRFYDKRRIGSIMSRVTHDAGRLEDFLVDGLPYLVVQSLMLFGIVIFLFVMNWKLTLFVLIPVPILVVGSLIFWKYLRQLFRKWWQRWAGLSAHLNESISGIRVVKAFAQELQEAERFGKRNLALFKAGTVAGRGWMSFFATMNLLTGGGVIIAWLVGGIDIIGERLTLGTLMAFIGFLWLLYGPLQWFGEINTWMTHAFAGAERIFEIIDAEEEAYDAPDAVPMPDIKGAVEFKDVTFGYDKHKPVLHHVSLKVQPGEMIGLVGKSGVGKTTTINLICRFYKADEGSISIDGVNINDIRLQDLRTQIGIVPQESFLFNGTIAENIHYGKPDASLEEVMQAAIAANAHNFIIAKPDGYDTQVGEHGGNLSVGEKQRIAIARAILRDPKILILDEATSSVDTETEKAIQEALRRLVKGRTTFAIAHRLSTLRNADRLVVLEDGKVIESGSHDELIAKKGVFYKLVKTQSETSKIMAIEG